ncbi:MAG TPA: DNA helicase RecQ [Clostridia bacterium]|nr:DNA helicase RecQ [Clostridia bacterium]
MVKEKILKDYFGYVTFREGQEELIDNILGGNDVVGIMPTGAGKSICFQAPALIFEGITLVISPLISLMKDQVESLIVNGVPAAFINSTLSNNQTFQVIENAKQGKYKIIYVAPERLDAMGFIEFAQSQKIAMIAVDEAHCVSQWGQNFRPSYLKISEFIKSLSQRPVISAFTATATSEITQDVIHLLELQKPLVISTGFDRENLYFEVQKPKDKYKALIKHIKENPDKSGIIYCATRKAVEQVCDNLIADGHKATRYHAGLSEAERTTNQDDFLYDRRTMMVATNAFGMGIDKSNVSFVIHYNMPKNIESYYQEAGRAGRDGTPADCILLYSGKDVVTNQFLIENTNENNKLDPETLELVKQKDRERLKQMTYYCHSFNCLREYILKYFGDKSKSYCGNCSNCNTNFEEVEITEYAQKILSCIVRMGERYGVKMIIDTLRGSKAEKVLKFRLDEVKTYGIMAEVKAKRIREIIDYLLVNEYLEQTNAEFPVIKMMPKANEILFNGEKHMMKIAKEQKKSARLADKRIQVNNDLFNTLREIRLDFAKLNNVPAFVIFTDASLIDMCSKLPTTGKEFLDVSGVGKVKLEQYGDVFIEAIKTFKNSNTPTQAVQQSSAAQTLEFVKNSIELSEDPLPIVFLADKINALLFQKSDKSVHAKKITDYLLEKGYLEVEMVDNRNSRVSSEKGRAIGITTNIMPSASGAVRKQNFYSSKAQAFIVDCLEDIIEW